MASRRLCHSRVTNMAAPLIAIAAVAIGATMLRKSIVGQAHAEAPNASPKVFSAGLNMVSLRLKSSEDVNHNTKRLRFEFPNPDAVSGLPLTSTLLTLSWPKGSWLPVPRPYTPVSRLDAPGCVEFMVKRYPNGKASTHLHSLQPGDKLLFAAALGGYPWTPNKHPHVALIAGGAGITPMYQLIRGIFHNPDDQTKVTLVFGVNTDADALLQKEFDALARRFPNRFRVVYTVSNPAPGSPFRRGYVTQELLREVLDGGEETKVLVCGPPAMETALIGGRGSQEAGLLEKLGYRKDQVYKF